jgi:hypothetical protein
MSEEWGISRVGKLEVEVGETLQEAIIRLQILPLPPVAWTDCFLQTVRGHQVTITGTETHPDKIEPSHVLPKLRTWSRKSTPRLRTRTNTFKRWCIPGGKPAVMLSLLKPTRGRNYRPSLTSSRKSSPNPNTPKTRVPTESHYLGDQQAKAWDLIARLTHPRRAIPRRDGGSPRNNNFANVRWMSLAGAEGAWRLVDVAGWPCGSRWCASPRPPRRRRRLPRQPQGPITVQHVEITAVIDTQSPHDSVADLVSSG